MKLDKRDLLLYAVTDRALPDGRTLYEQVEAALEGGATFVQFREKGLSGENFLKEALEIKGLCRKYGVPFVIDDNVEAALKIGADGVHVGQGDADAGTVRALIGKDKILGVTAHTVPQAIAAEKNGADYIGAGAAFKTGTKQGAEVISRQTLKEICGAVKIPVVAIGGINAGNVILLKGVGICGVAVISAIFGAKDVKKATADLKKAVRAAIYD